MEIFALKITSFRGFVRGGKIEQKTYTVTKGLTYTFEEYNILLKLNQFLNSRLMPIPSDPNDIFSLSPSQFLIGALLSQPVSKNYIDIPDNHLSRWQHILKLKQHFWHRWQKEYLHHLQNQTKWTTEVENLKTDTVVLLAEENQTPLQWILGRVVKVYPGTDGVVRVADVKTSHGQFRKS